MNPFPHGFSNEPKYWVEVTKIKEKEMNNMSISWLRGSDSNGRPPGYEPGELPTAPPRDVISDLRLQS